ncbi:MAG: hypothetical protein CL607_04265 [Anaerolineaceae bacterium]|nr:hypothetical protein [Anaerolineaceae bacterium]
MTTSKQETEVKLHTPNLKSIVEVLEANGAKLVSERVFERNVRYEDHEHGLTPQGIVVRLRQDVRTLLTYKGPGVVENGIISREEFEVEVDDYDMMDLILDRLGYFPFMAYEKYRTTYELDGAEIVLDELPYGNFTEIEGDVTTIEATVKKLKLSEAERLPHSYASIFDIVRQNLELDMPHLTFDAFEGIVVPAEALIKPDSDEEDDS